MTRFLGVVFATPGKKGNAMMRARFLVVNALVLGLGALAWQAGYLSAFARLEKIELVMLAAIGLYAVVGFGCIFLGRIQSASHVANQLAIWGLAFTGAALMIAIISASQDKSANSAAMMTEIALAIAPNIVATALMAWLRDCAWWAARASL